MSKEAPPSEGSEEASPYEPTRRDFLGAPLISIPGVVAIGSNQKKHQPDLGRNLVKDSALENIRSCQEIMQRVYGIASRPAAEEYERIVRGGQSLMPRYVEPLFKIDDAQAFGTTLDARQFALFSDSVVSGFAQFPPDLVRNKCNIREVCILQKISYARDSVHSTGNLPLADQMVSLRDNRKSDILPPISLFLPVPVITANDPKRRLIGQQFSEQDLKRVRMIHRVFMVVESFLNLPSLQPEEANQPFPLSFRREMFLNLMTAPATYIKRVAKEKDLVRFYQKLKGELKDVSMGQMGEAYWLARQGEHLFISPDYWQRTEGKK